MHLQATTYQSCNTLGEQSVNAQTRRQLQQHTGTAREPRTLCPPLGRTVTIEIWDRSTLAAFAQLADMADGRVQIRVCPLYEQQYPNSNSMGEYCVDKLFVGIQNVILQARNHTALSRRVEILIFLV